MNHYKYTKKEPNLNVCNICHHKFKQIYNSPTNEDIEMRQIHPKVDKSIILNSLIQSLKSNVDELQLENEILNKSLTFYRDLSSKSIQQRF